MNSALHCPPQAVPVIARAIVRANNDPDKLGRIRVEYPWFGSETANLPSEWARVCFPYASSESGSWMIPEINDEVIVMFENGNLDTPIVLGTLYSGKNRPPKSGRGGDLNDDNKNNLKFFRTRTGHTLCFDDSDSNAGIVLKDRDNRRIEIFTKEKKIEISDPGGSRITLDESGITIQNAQKINLGEGASHALIHGDTFQQLFNAHTHPIPSGNTGPTSQPMTPAMLSIKVKSV